jgi:hypothetical protein
MMNSSFLRMSNWVDRRDVKSDNDGWHSRVVLAKERNLKFTRIYKIKFELINAKVIINLSKAYVRKAKALM